MTTYAVPMHSMIPRVPSFEKGLPGCSAAPVLRDSIGVRDHSPSCARCTPVPGYPGTGYPGYGGSGSGSTVERYPDTPKSSLKTF
eukprot:612309-Rhodomonas_salina.1